MKHQLTIHYEEFSSFSELPEKERLMIEKASVICEKAYSPYSSFNVGATLLLSNGEFVSGSNQENIAYPSGICAERVALFFAGSNFSNESIETIAIVSRGELLKKDQILSPCGACRQVLNESEFRQKRPIRVILTSQDGRVVVFSSVVDLLPFTFGK